MGKSIYDQFHEAALEYPHNLAVRFERKTWSYHQLSHEIDRCARKLLALGIKEKEPIAVSMPNCPEAVYLFYAISKIGAISYNIHPLTPPLMMRSLIQRSGCRFLICLTFSAGGYREVLDNDIRILSVNPYKHINPIKYLALKFSITRTHGVENYRKIKPVKKDFHANVNDEDDAVYLNTGGTNGEPKIVRLSNAAINSIPLKGYALIGGEITKIRLLTAIPMFHGFGLEMGIHTPLSFGASTVLMLKFNTKEAIHHIKKGHATVLLGVPALYNALLSRDSFYGPWLKNQVCAFIGGDSVPQSLLDRWNAAMERFDSKARLYQGYGLSETMSVSNVNCVFHDKRGTIGQPLPGLKELIVDPETKQVLPPNTNGEILISGISVMSGYLHDEQNSAGAFITIDGTRYFQTGDYGSMDEEGYLTYKNRIKRVEKINGETVCPSDVEQVALDNPEVYEAYCYGVPNERKGHVLRLLIVLRRGDHPANPETVKAEIYDDLSKRLTANYKPDKIVVIPRLPRTPIGKIDTRAVETMGEEGEL
jgi:long-chain acyl-CoA synthetase